MIKSSNAPGVQLCLACLALGLAGVALARAGQLWEGFDLFSQFALQFMMLIVASLAGLASRWRKPVIAAAVFAAMILAYGAWPHAASALTGEASAPRASARALKVAHFNMWLPNRHLADLKAEILRLDADVIVLVEVSNSAAAMLSEVKGAYPHQYICHESSVCHLAILSRVPLRDMGYKAGWKGPPMVRAALGGRFDGITVFGIHTTRFPHSRAQLRQARGLAEELRKVQGPVIVMGDFNATPASRVTQTVAEQGGMRRLTSLPTWPAQFWLPQVAIDHVFASPQISVLRPQTIGRPSGSDHYPITMVLAVP